MEDIADERIEEVIKDHYPAILQWARRMLWSEDDAEDTAQEVVLALLKAPQLLAGVECLGAWLFRFVGRRSIDLIRSQSRRRKKESERPSPGSSDDSDVIALLVRKDADASVEKAIGSLSEELRYALISNTVKGMTFREMQEESGIPMGTLMARKKKALELLESELTPEKL